MHLARLEISGFRAFERAQIDLRPAVTVLLGENSSGKSGAIDALRLLTDPLDGRRALWADRDDVCRTDEQRSSFSLAMTLRGTLAELAPYSDATIPSTAEALENDARYTLTYQAPAAGETRGRTTWTAGSGAVADDPDPGARGRLRHVYLPPLRDAVRELGPAGGARVRAIIERLLDGDPRGTATGADEQAYDRARFHAEVGEHLRQIESNPVLKRASATINIPLSSLTSGAYEHMTDLGYGREDLASLIRGLRLQMADAGVEPRELAESGMGYANLAYVATVLTHLHKAAQADLTLLLVEEPEAHLHPQLQAVLLDYLTRTARESQEVSTNNRWLGRIQVVLTTHAPLLAASTDVADIVVLQRHRTQAPIPAQATAADDDSSTHRPVRATFTANAVAVNAIDLSASHRARVNRYLDATRSSLLFGPRTILVEGIAEALLLPAMADELFAGPDREEDRTRFVGSTIVPIDGVDFEPYLRLLLTKTPSGRIAQRVAVLTDTDPGKRRDPIGALRRLITSLDAQVVARVFPAPSTLEPELYEAARPASTAEFWSAWAEQRPTGSAKVQAKVEAAATPDERARILISAMKRTRLRKGDFAQDLLDHTCAQGRRLAVPPYIGEALSWLVGRS